MTWRAGNGRNGDSYVPVAPWTPIVREAWRTHTLGELHAMTGVSPTVLHNIIHGKQDSMRLSTAVKLKVALLP